VKEASALQDWLKLRAPAADGELSAELRNRGTSATVHLMTPRWHQLAGIVGGAFQRRTAG